MKHQKELCDLLYAYELVLTEMRTHALPGGIVREWVTRLDMERDFFAGRIGQSPDRYCEKILAPQVTDRE